MKTKTKRINKPKVAKNKDYLASIKVLGKVYQAKGSTIREAIENLKAGNVAKGMSVLTVSKGKDSHSKILPPNQTFRLFAASRLMRELALKNIVMRFPEL